jgi:hypothetical protein
MRRILILAVALTAFAPAAFAAQPVSLSDAQMDAVTAGLKLTWTQGGIAFTANNTPPLGLGVSVVGAEVRLRDVAP